MPGAKTEFQTDITGHFERATIHALETVAGVTCRRVGEDEQKRHTGRMMACQIALIGEDWLGCLVVLVPFEGAERIAGRMRDYLGTPSPDEGRSNRMLNEALGALAAGIGISLSGGFEDEGAVTLGLPLVVNGQALSIAFPWDNHFETRLCFESDETPLWSILRISRTHG